MYLMVSCEAPQDFQGIKWDVDISLPLINRSYPIYDLEDEENFVVEDTLLTLFIEEEVESGFAGESIFLQSKTSITQDLYPVAEKLDISLPIDESGLADEDIDLTYALISQGTINVELTEVIEELNELEIIFTDIITPDNKQLTMLINEFDQTVFSEDISNCFIGDEQGTVIIDSLNFKVKSSHKETFEVLGKIRIYFDEPLYFDHFRGYLKNKKVSIDDQIIKSNINYPHNISNAIELDKVILELLFTNEMGFDAYLTGTMRAINTRDNKEYILDLTREDNILFNRAESLDRPSETKVVIDHPKLTGLINIFPETLIIEDAQLIMGNKDDSPGFATFTQRSFGKIKLSSQSVFRINNSTIVPDTVHSVEISEENRQYIKEYPQEVVMSFMMQNKLPLGALVGVYFSDSPDTLDIFGYTQQNSVNNLAFTDNYVGSRVSHQEPGIYNVDFHLDRKDIELFLNEEIYFALKITFDHTETTVAVRPDDYIKIIGSLNIRLRIDI